MTKSFVVATTAKLDRRETRRGIRVLAGSAGVVALVLAAAGCSNSPSVPAPRSGTTTTSGRLPPRNFPRGSTSTTAAGAGTSTTTTAAGGAGRQASGATPTLGIASPWGASAVGFGQVQPAEISLGGDPTGMLTGIAWQSWGGSSATGAGTGTYVGPNQTVAQGTRERAIVVASDLGTCGGVPVYQQVKWYYPEQGETLSNGSNSTINTCAGP